MSDIKTIVRLVGSAVLTFGALYLIARLCIGVIGWHRRRPAYIKDYSEGRERLAVGILLTRRCRVLRLPGAWVTISRPLYTAASDRGEWSAHVAFALAALQKAKRHADESKADR